MKMKIIFAFLFCIYSGSWAVAQSLSPEIISSEGSTSSTPTISIEWTLGELRVSNFLTDNFMLTEGFHQPILEVSEVLDFYPLAARNGNGSIEDVQVKVWPNPFDAMINIQVEAPSDEILFVQCFNTLGKSISLQKEIFSNEISKLSFDGYSPGIYFLQVTDKEKKHLKTMIINKL